MAFEIEKKLFKSVKKYCACALGKVDINFRDLDYSVKLGKILRAKKEKIILDGLSGTFKHGQLHAIMGPSGAGKSTLLNVLVGYIHAANGTISLNGTDFSPSNKYMSTISAVSSYILQHDYLQPELTVWETMYYASRFKYPTIASEQERNKMIRHILRVIFLEEFKHRSVRFLSGGQLKRLAVAVELVNAKPVMFLDEPTTGLDSTSCYQLIKVLKALANSGSNVICVIHQPNSLVYQLFDTLYLLAPGGRIAFNGLPTAVKENLAAVGAIVPIHCNIAEVLFKSNNIPKLAAYNEKQLVSNHKHSFPTLSNRQPIEEVENHCNLARLSIPLQAFVLLSRMFRQSFRDRDFTMLRFISYAWLGLLIGNGFLGVGRSAHVVWANLGLFTNLINITLLSSMIITVKRFGPSFNVLIREDVNSWYSVSCYYFVKAVFEAVFEAMFTAMCAAVIYFMSDQIQDPAVGYPLILIVVTLNSLVAQQLMYVICALMLDEQTTFNIPYMFSLFQGLFGGYVISYTLAPSATAWMKHFWFFVYGFFGLLKIIYSKTTSGHEIVLPCEVGSHPNCDKYPNGTALLIARGVDPDVPVTYDLKIMSSTWYLGLILVGWLVAVMQVRKAKLQLARA